MDNLILDKILLRERLKNLIFPSLFIVLSAISFIYWRKEMSAPVGMFQGEILRLESPVIGRGTEQSPKTVWEISYLAKLIDGKIVIVKVPDTIALLPGDRIQISGYKTTLGKWSYTYVATISGQPGAPPDADSGRR